MNASRLACLDIVMPGHSREKADRGHDEVRSVSGQQRSHCCEHVCPAILLDRLKCNGIESNLMVVYNTYLDVGTRISRDDPRDNNLAYR